MRAAERLSWFAVIVISLLSCSTLPDYAVGTAAVVDPASVDLSDIVSYRALTRADFKAEAVPAHFASVTDRIGAATCCHIRTAPGAQFASRPFQTDDGELRYEASPVGLRFHAQMNRKCSWWNPKDLGIPLEYILEHEQIHFALCELETRRMNASLQAGEPELRATAATPEAAGSIVQDQVDEQLREHVRSLAARNRSFDEDTSMGHNPKTQKRWLSEVEAELAATGD